MFAVVALLVLVVGAVLDWQKADHASTFLFVGLALIAAHLAFETYVPGFRRRV